MAAVGQPSAIRPDNYRFLQELIYTGSGIVLEEDKQYLFESRLSPLARTYGATSVDDLCALLRATTNSALQSKVVEAMTTNETYFFREPAQYEIIRTTLLPSLRELQSGTRKLSFWSAAASTGQEAYSLAMLLLEEGFPASDVQILGTDLSSNVLDKAAGGRYLQIDVNRNLPAPLLMKHFQRQGADWQLSDTVRHMVRFERLDLRRPMRGLGPFDLVFCRNVLVYFDSATRHTILKEIHGTLFRGGWLLLGAADVPAGLDELFERRTIGAVTVCIAR
jgi:chemotaxis protein methyltransferase CheR